MRDLDRSFSLQLIMINSNELSFDIHHQPAIMKKFTFQVEVDVAQLTAAYLSALDLTEPDSLHSMVEHECHWLEESGIHVRNISEIV